MDMKVGRALVLLALTSLAVLFSNVETSEASSTIISIQPSTTTVSVSQNFTVDIYIENVIDLFAWQARLSWDPSLLEVVDAAEGDFFPSEYDFLYLTNQSEGWVYCFCPWLYWSECGVNGSGTLANITFHYTGPEECLLDLKETKLIDASPIWVSTPPYLGDTDGDMFVGTHDFSLMVYCFREQIYDPNADFNSDGSVDLYDLTCMYFNWDRSVDVDALQPVEIAHEVQDGYVNSEEPVGGIWVPVDKFGLLAPYIGLASTILVATAATAVYVKRVKRRKEKQ